MESESDDMLDFKAEFRALRQATTAGFSALRADMNDGFDRIDVGFMEMRAKFDATAAGQQQIVDLIQGLIDDRNGGESGTPTR